MNNDSESFGHLVVVVYTGRMECRVVGGKGAVGRQGDWVRGHLKCNKICKYSRTKSFTRAPEREPK